MKKGFYGKLAWIGIRKNKKLYTPYILTCIGMVMMFYIITFLADSAVLLNMKGGDTMQSMLGLGCGIIGVFSLIFLFYTNSFLIRRRKKEFGLYNILGMGKRNLAVVLLWETVIIAGISLTAGLAAGIVFSKFAELGMINILKGTATFSINIAPYSIWQTLVLFGGIFFLILLNTLRQIHLTNPIELLHSENTGEKPPKANWLIALIGVIILATAYFLAVSIEDPITAMVWFFAAVIMVIIATYLLFIAGSVTICKILQKNKKYYYKTNHFVSISSMAYRMKRNGAGLASICILCTIVLVMVSTTVCLYAGAEDSLRTRYPRNININAKVSDIALLNSDKVEAVRELSKRIAAQNGQEVKNVLDYRMVGFAGYVKDGRIETDNPAINTFDFGMYEDVWQIFIVPLEDYNRLMGEDVTLSYGEALLYTTKLGTYTEDTISIDEGEKIQIKKRVSDFADNGVDAMQIIPSMYLFVPDFEDVVMSLMRAADKKEGQMISIDWFYGFDLECNDATQIDIQDQIQSGLQEIEDRFFVVLCEGVAKEKAGFYGMYGGLFFLGILLGIVFLFAAVLIIYYKQVSEGYEDQSRFEIMQKVGMTKKEIKRSINSQILTVFFLPLLVAGIHLSFAFPMISKMIALLNLTNIELLTLVTVCCYLIFTMFYIVVYKITSKAYYSIVSSAEKEYLST